MQEVCNLNPSCPCESFFFDESEITMLLNACMNLSWGYVRLVASAEKALHCVWQGTTSQGSIFVNDSHFSFSIFKALAKVSISAAYVLTSSFIAVQTSRHWKFFQ